MYQSTRTPGQLALSDTQTTSFSVHEDATSTSSGAGPSVPRHYDVPPYETPRAAAAAPRHHHYGSEGPIGHDDLLGFLDHAFPDQRPRLGIRTTYVSTTSGRSGPSYLGLPAGTTTTGAAVSASTAASAAAAAGSRPGPGTSDPRTNGHSSAPPGRFHWASTLRAAAARPTGPAHLYQHHHAAAADMTASSHHFASVDDGNLEFEEDEEDEEDDVEEEDDEASHPLQTHRITLPGASYLMPFISRAAMMDRYAMMMGGAPRPRMIDVDANRTAWVISCRGCRTRVSQRGIRAVLLADNQVHLFSTDLPPEGCMLMDGIYQTDNCACLIKDTGCRTCGNVLGYHISRPCAQCLSSPNNGHLWIFSSNAICSEERRSKSTDDIMIWGQLPRVEKSESHEMLDQYDQHCR